MTSTLTATLYPPGRLEIGPELLLTTLWEKIFDSSAVAAVVNELVPWRAWLLRSALEVLRLRLLWCSLFILKPNISQKTKTARLPFSQRMAQNKEFHSIRCYNKV